MTLILPVQVQSWDFIVECPNLFTGHLLLSYQSEALRPAQSIFSSIFYRESIATLPPSFEVHPMSAVNSVPKFAMYNFGERRFINSTWIIVLVYTSQQSRTWNVFDEVYRNMSSPPKLWTVSTSENFLPYQQS